MDPARLPIPADLPRLARRVCVILPQGAAYVPPTFLPPTCHLTQKSSTSSPVRLPTPSAQLLDEEERGQYVISPEKAILGGRRGLNDAELQAERADLLRHVIISAAVMLHSRRVRRSLLEGTEGPSKKRNEDEQEEEDEDEEVQVPERWVDALIQTMQGLRADHGDMSMFLNMVFKDLNLYDTAMMRLFKAVQQRIIYPPAYWIKGKVNITTF